jgi:pyruvate formate lyase activating enzyme
VLHDSGADIILRCPIIPTVNGRDYQFEGIAKLVKELPNLRGVELMAYHDTGRDKAAEIGMQNLFYNIDSATDKMKQSWIQKLNNLSIDNVRIG